jgi:FtsZ-binding cell division protein ZapB
VRLAKSARPLFEAELAELKHKRAEVQEEIYSAEFDRLSGELSSLDPEMSAHAEQLKTLIGKRQSLFSEMSQVANKYDQSLAQSLADSSMREGRNTMARLFPREWLRRRRPDSSS